MQKINELPNITLEDIGREVTLCLDDQQVQFKVISESSWAVRVFSKLFSEFYFAYKNTIYVPEGHVALAQSTVEHNRVIATSKLLPWVYAIKNGSVNTIPNFLYTMFNTNVRCYYFLFEFALLKSHDLVDTPELVAMGFISTRRNFLGIKKNPDNILKELKKLLEDKIVKPD